MKRQKSQNAKRAGISKMCKKDFMVIAFYMALASLVLLGSILEPQHCDAILFCAGIYILSVIPTMLIVKGYIK